MVIDKKKFYTYYRREFGRIRRQATVDTINAILDRAQQEGTPLEHVAYMFATAYHEARDAKYLHDFSPIIERGSYRYITKLYWLNPRVRRWLGNDTIDEAWKYRGRGLVQLTGETNYQKFGLENNPDKALDPRVAVDIMFTGMRKGIFTGKRLSDYINRDRKSYYYARQIINGMDKAGRIAAYAEKFERILKHSAR